MSTNISALRKKYRCIVVHWENIVVHWEILLCTEKILLCTDKCFCTLRKYCSVLQYIYVHAQILLCIAYMGHRTYQKLCRGEFSTSPRVSTFLSTISRYQVLVQHIAGASILPSDFASRNAPDCRDMACQVCNFINTTQSSVIRRTSVAEILAGKTHLPFTSRAAWLSIQAECPDLRRTHAHLRQGTRPSKRITNIKDVKRYLNVTTIARDGLAPRRRSEPLLPTRECTVVPRQVLDGF
jgi:hypothetical protein